MVRYNLPRQGKTGGSFLNQKTNLMAFNPLTHLKESRAELNKVVWPTRMETVRLTLVVIIVSIIVGLYIAGLDAVFTKFTEKFFK